MYTEKVIDHFTTPRNCGKMEKPDGVGKVGNPTCGDMMEIYIKVDNGKLSDVMFQTFGCAAAIATSSMTTELAKGMTLQEAADLTRNEVADSLGGLPPVKLHCSNLAADGLHEALKDYCRKNGVTVEGLDVNAPPPEEDHDDHDHSHEDE